MHAPLQNRKKEPKDAFSYDRVEGTLLRNTVKELKEKPPLCHFSPKSCEDQDLEIREVEKIGMIEEEALLIRRKEKKSLVGKPITKKTDKKDAEEPWYITHF